MILCVYVEEYLKFDNRIQPSNKTIGWIFLFLLKISYKITKKLRKYCFFLFIYPLQIKRELYIISHIIYMNCLHNATEMKQKHKVFFQYTYRKNNIT